MVDNLDIPLKFEDFEADLMYQTFYIGSEVNIHENSNLPRSFITRVRYAEPKNWVDELSEFSSDITQQTHITLDRIKMVFHKNGMKFDADFRNHFLYTANNRLAESFDAFLIGLPREMKSSDCLINKAPEIPGPIAENEFDQNESIETPIKRIRIEENVITELSTNEIENDFETESEEFTSQTQVPPQQNASNDKPVLLRTEVLQNVLPKRNIFLDKTIESLKRRLISDQNRISAARMSLDEMVSIPTLCIGTQSNDAPKASETAGEQSKVIQKKPQEVEKGKAAARQIIKRRQTFAAKDLVSHRSRNRICSESQLSVTLPNLSGIITRSRSNAIDMARAVQPFQCEKCSYSTNISSNFQGHLFIHTDQKLFKCKHCTKDFIKTVNLKSHLKTHHHSLHGDADYWKE